MNGLQRIRSALSFEDPDRVPVIGQVFGHAAVLSGVPLTDYIRNGELLARCQIKALDYYGYDAVFALMDTAVETEALGSELSYRDNQYPSVSSHILDDKGDCGGLSLPDPEKAGRMPELLKAAKILRSQVGNEVLVAGCVMGPMTLAIQLMGLEKALYLAADNPEQFSGVLDFSTKVIIRFGLAQLNAGVHLPLVFDPSASPAVVPASFFREFLVPRLQEVFSAFEKAGTEANWLHITGPTIPILPYYSEIGAGIANIDYPVELKDASRLLSDICINGNIKPLVFLENTPEEIAEEVRSVVQFCSQRKGFILSPGCEIPPEAKPGNVMAMMSSVTDES